MAFGELILRNYNYLFINDDDYKEIKSLILEHLIGLCWGTENQFSECYNLCDVIDEFLTRFESKSEEQKYGYIGEFLFYLYIIHNNDVIKPYSIFFNQDERSFKIGFDLLGFDGVDIWYSEVKSGNKNDKIIDDYNNERLNTAYRDIKEKLALKNRNTNYWDTAKSNIIKFHFSDINERKQIVNILTEDRNKEVLNNAIIVSVVFDDSDLELNLEKIMEKYNSLKVEKENITVVCIRKRTIDNIIKIFYDIRNGQNEL